MLQRRFPPCLTVVLLGLSLLAGPAPAGGAARPPERRVIVFLWDGLRPDSIGEADTPRLLALSRAGVGFTDNHATYPTFTMMNSAAIATGAYSDTSGFFGNTVFRPEAATTTGAGAAVDFSQPIFVEDRAVLEALDASYGGRLVTVPTLFQAAQRGPRGGRPLRTVVVGKRGAAFLQDHKRGGMILEESMVWPLELAKRLQAAGFPLPRRSPAAFAAGQLALAPDNGDPTRSSRSQALLADGVTVDPTDASPPSSAEGNQYLMRVYTSYLLPRERPDLSLIWLRSPDGSEHASGVGTPAARAALRAQDDLLGQLEEALARLGLAATTDLIVMSDHGQSSVAGPAALFPPRAVVDGAVGAVTGGGGYSVSGEVRLADLLTRAGFVAYDGGGCSYLPVLSGIRADGSPLYPAITAGEGGDGCGCAWAGKRYTFAARRVPGATSFSPHSLVVASNGGSDYVYVPDHDAETVGRLVRFLQSREEVGPIFVAGRYGAVPGTLPLAAIRLESPEGRNPDVVLSYSFDEDAAIAGAPGTEMAGTESGGSRGMHGSFSPRDVHNVLIAAGPHFRAHFSDPLPSANVDVAPTVARILGLELPSADGRPLLEALAGGAAVGDYAVEAREVDAPPATGLRVALPTDPNGAAVDAAVSTYRVHLQAKVLRHAGREFTYLDLARAVRR